MRERYELRGMRKMLIGDLLYKNANAEKTNVPREGCAS